MAPGVSSDDGSMRSRSVRCGSAGAAAKRELRRPKQETLDQLNMTMMSTKEVAGKGARGLQVDINDNLRLETRFLILQLNYTPISNYVGILHMYFDSFDVDLRSCLYRRLLSSHPGVPTLLAKTRLFSHSN